MQSLLVGCRRRSHNARPTCVPHPRRLAQHNMGTDYRSGRRPCTCTCFVAYILTVSESCVVCYDASQLAGDSQIDETHVLPDYCTQQQCTFRHVLPQSHENA